MGADGSWITEFPYTVVYTNIQPVVKPVVQPAVQL